MVATFKFELVKSIGVVVLLDIKFIIRKGDWLYIFVGIEKTDKKVGVILATVKVVFLGVGALKLAVATWVAVIVVVPALTIVTVMPEMVATDKLELV